LNIENNNEYKNATKAFYEFYKNFPKAPLQSINQFQVNNIFNKNKFINYQDTIQTIFHMLNSELKQSKKRENKSLETSKQYNEIEEKKKFKENNEDSIIKKIFYSIKEIKSLCKECNMPNYNFEYIPFFLINNQKEIMLI